MRKAIVALLAAIPVMSYASCPVGWHQQGGFCVANGVNAMQIVPLSGNSCPVGWSRQGSFCVANSAISRQIVPVNGASCPVGWSRQGNFCVSNTMAVSPILSPSPIGR